MIIKGVFYINKSENYKQLFLDNGYIPLDTISNILEKIKCVDQDGYMYYSNYKNLSDNIRENSRLDKWKKSNPFKAYNMRLYANKVQENVCILSTDEELKEASNNKIKFVCPNCGKEYEKKWCYWIGQPNNVHFCVDCMKIYSAENRTYTYEQLKEIYNKYGYELIGDYDYYLNNGKMYVRMPCIYKNGYKYAINLNSLRSGACGGNNTFSITNPFAIENLQKFLNKNSIDLKVLSFLTEENKSKRKFLVQCCCGETFCAYASNLTTFAQIQCPKCAKNISSYERLVMIWLEENNISYKKEFIIKECRYKRPLPFDFKCDYKNDFILIEADGRQHFEEIEYFQEPLALRQKKDNIKNQYCKKHNIKLLRIPYWEFDNKNYIDILNQTFFG